MNTQKLLLTVIIVSFVVGIILSICLFNNKHLARRHRFKYAMFLAVSSGAFIVAEFCQSENISFYATFVLIFCMLVVVNDGIKQVIKRVVARQRANHLWAIVVCFNALMLCEHGHLNLNDEAKAKLTTFLKSVSDQHRRDGYMRAQHIYHSLISEHPQTFARIIKQKDFNKVIRDYWQKYND